MTAAERDALVTDNLGLARMVANKFSRKAAAGTEFDDLYSAACTGLMHAAARYDPARYLKFSTYAVNVMRGYVLHEMRNRGSLIRVPSYLTGEERTEALRRVRTVPLRRVMQDSGSRTRREDDTTDPADPGSSRPAQISEAALDVVPLLARLRPRELTAVRMRMEGAKLDAIALELGVSRERARQVCEEALEKMRSEE